MMKKAILLYGLLIPSQVFAWGNDGHEAVVAVALKMNPGLRPRMAAVLQELPNSALWQSLRASGLTHSPFEWGKEDPDGWVASLAFEPEKAATFADWARDYAAYDDRIYLDPASTKMYSYGDIHFINLNYANGSMSPFGKTPNAVTMLTQFQKNVKTKTGGEQAWSLVWVLHLVGDLHQPLHCTARALPGSGKSDTGGNGVTYKGKKLHSWWDHLPDNGNTAAYAANLVSNKATIGGANFDSLATVLSASKWAKEGQKEILAIGYPADHKVANYPVEAKKIANRRVLLAGARLARILDAILPR